MSGLQSGSNPGSLNELLPASKTRSQYLNNKLHRSRNSSLTHLVVAGCLLSVSAVLFTSGIRNCD